MRLSRGNATDLSRSIGGLLLGTGAVILFARKSGHHAWSDYALMLVVLIPAIVLYALALGLLDPPGEDRPRPWQTVLMVEAILLWPIALIAFMQWVGAHANHPLYLAGVFTITCLLAAYATRHARIRYAALLAGLSSLIAWFYVWEKLLHNPSANTVRWLLVAAGALLLIVAARLARARAIGASEIATAGGIAAMGAGVFGVVVGGVVAVFRPLLAITEGPSVTTTTSGRLRARPISLEGSMPRAVRTYSASHHRLPARPLALHRAFPATPIPHRVEAARRRSLMSLTRVGFNTSDGTSTCSSYRWRSSSWRPAGIYADSATSAGLGCSRSSSALPHRSHDSRSDRPRPRAS
jgi:hypothetical protein